MALKLQYPFSKTNKVSMTAILDKYSSAPPHHDAVRAALQVPGDVMLWRHEALYLAGIVQPYYARLSDRLRSHPGDEGLTDFLQTLRYWLSLFPCVRICENCGRKVWSTGLEAAPMFCGRECFEEDGIEF